MTDNKDHITDEEKLLWKLFKEFNDLADNPTEENKARLIEIATTWQLYPIRRTGEDQK